MRETLRFVKGSPRTAEKTENNRKDRWGVREARNNRDYSRFPTLNPLPPAGHASPSSLSGERGVRQIKPFVGFGDLIKRRRDPLPRGPSLSLSLSLSLSAG